MLLKNLDTVAPSYICPEHGTPLDQGPEQLVCSHNHGYPVLNGVPRFVTSGYAESFGRQWQRFRLTQLDSHTRLPLSEERLRRCLGWQALPVATKGKAILEAGCGAGRFTEVLLKITEAHVTSVDMSDAVVANAENFPPSDRHRIAQSDILKLPFAPRSFDYVICLGVVQHTPSPEETIRALWDQVKPGGWLVFDHYAWGLSRLTRPAQLWRQLLKRLPEEKKLPTAEKMVDVLLPFHERHQKFGRLISRLSPVLSFYHIHPGLRPELQREWAILDTHDTMTDHYKHLRTLGQIRRTLERFGGEQIWASKSGNGIEARIRRPEAG